MDSEQSNIVIFEEIILLVTGIFVILIGWSLYPIVTQTKNNLFSFLKRLNFALLGGSIACVSFFQYERYNLEDSEELEGWQIASSLGIGLSLFIITAILPFIGSIMSSIYICIVLSIVTVNQIEFDTELIEYSVVTSSSLIGGALLFWFANKLSIVNGIVSTYTGGLLIYASTACYTGMPTINLVYLITGQNLGYCLNLESDYELWVYPVGASILAGTGALVQIFLAIIVTTGKFFTKKKQQPIISDQIMRLTEFISRVHNLYNQQGIDNKHIVENEKEHLKVILDNAIGQFAACTKKFLVSESRVRMYVKRWLENNQDYERPDLHSPFPREYGKNITIRSLMRRENWLNFLESIENGEHMGNEVTLIAISEVFHCKINIFSTLDENKIVSIIPITQNYNKIQPDLMCINDMENQISTDIHSHSTGIGGDTSTDISSRGESHLLSNNEIEYDYEDNNELLNFPYEDDDIVIDDDNNNGEHDNFEILTLYHYHKKHYGGILPADKLDDLNTNIILEEQSPSIDIPYTVMDAEEKGMNECIPAGSKIISMLVLGLSILSGLWWLIFLVFWGQDWQNFYSIIGFLIFVISEAINFVLSIIYHVNFLFPVSRRWKSLDHLSDAFKTKPQIDCLIFHCSESVDTTKDTLLACLAQKKHEMVYSDIYICDDGFWKKDEEKRDPLLKPIIPKEKRYCSWITDFPKKCISCCSSYFSFENENKKENNIVEEEEEEELIKEERYEEIPVPKNEIKKTSQPSSEVLDYIKLSYGFVPSALGQQLLTNVVDALNEYYGNQYENSDEASKIEIQYKCFLTKLVEDGGGKDGYGAIVRRDCCVASVKFSFRAKLPEDDKYPERLKYRPTVNIVARVKLKGKPHHYKAGNINNCLYNELEHNNDRFVCFFDNDMAPTPDFLMRTLPFFYTYNAKDKEYLLNKRVSFIQTPQYFSDDTLDPVLDYLASKNSIFFQAIQKGRDGINSCAFAGTNAVFRVGCLYAIGGMPYGSVTEDALAGRCLHKAGYRSVYAEEKLAVGEAPTTVASSMKQRMRWCKGSVQILLLHIFGLKPSEISEFHPGLEPEKEETDSFKFIVQREDKIKNRILQTCFSLDTMLYPVSAITAIGYMFVALIFAYTAVAPITFTTRFGYMAFIFTFVPYFAVKFLASFTSYIGKVDPDEIWIAQQTWFGYAFGAVVGIFDALRFQFTGKGLSWGVTGEAERRNWLEYFNVIVVMLLIIGIIIRLFSMLLNVETSLIDLGAIFFAGTIAFQMWPMVSMSLYEWIYNTALNSDERDELKRFTAPKYIIYVILLMIVIAAGVLLQGEFEEEQNLYETLEYY